MAASLDDSGFWLPGDDQNLAGLCFPTEFPYEVESVFSSTETDGSDEDDFLAGLSRRLAQTSFQDPNRLTEKPETENKWVSGGSPQSTLSGMGYLSGRSNGSSPPTGTPLGLSEDTWELIYAAAGEVARLRMSDEAARLKGRGLLGPPRNTSFFSNHTAARNIPHTNQFPCPAIWGRKVNASWAAQLHPHPHPQQHIYMHNRVRNAVYENRGCGASHSTWPQLQSQQSQAPPNVPGMRPAGTGVFLPRRYANPAEHRKKAGCTPVLVPAKVVQALNLSFNDINGHSQPRPGGGVGPDHEAVMARRGALLMQQRSMRVSPAGHFGHEVRLPQEWTY